MTKTFPKLLRMNLKLKNNQMKKNMNSNNLKRMKSNLLKEKMLFKLK